MVEDTLNKGHLTWSQVPATRHCILPPGARHKRVLEAIFQPKHLSVPGELRLKDIPYVHMYVQIGIYDDKYCEQIHGWTD